MYFCDVVEEEKEKVRKVAWKEGMASGLAEGRASGLAEGRASGLADGRAESKKEIVKKMKANHIEISVITDCTGLSKEEIEAI